MRPTRNCQGVFAVPLFHMVMKCCQTRFSADHDPFCAAEEVFAAS